MMTHPQAAGFILPDNPLLQYTGRIDDTDPLRPVFHYVCSGVHLRMQGRTLRMQLINNHSFWENRLGVMANGVQHALLLQDGQQTLDLSPFLQDGENDVLIFKRQDSCHAFTLLGFDLGEGGALLPVPPLPRRRMEVYGDSVSAGEVSEAEDYAGKSDPEHQGQYSNGWWSYAWLTARRLNAQLHNIAQGGISLQDGTGYFNAPDYLGMLSTYDKVAYNPALGPRTAWDFSRYRPHVVVVAIGQNDAHPCNIMEEDDQSPAARRWKEDYARFIRLLRKEYPKATIILTTTILFHAPQWDKAIGEVCSLLRKDDPRIHHFLYRKNGAGTPGHIRASEAEGMAEELSTFITSLGEDIWQDE